MDTVNTPFTTDVCLNGRYDILSPLNHGSFGVVVLARDRQLDQLVAIKCLDKIASPQEGGLSLQIDDRSEELDIHSRICNHPNIVNLLDSFGTATHTFIVLEYCSMGDLYEAIRHDRGPKETEHVRDFMLQLVNAVEFLHNKGVYHRDIKPENIFLTDNGAMKLGDFGLATTETWSPETAVGSDRYMAPEQYDTNGDGLSPRKADIWSIGICMLNILFARNPFGVPATSDRLYEDFVCDRQSLFDVFPNMHDDTFEVLNYCLQIDPTRRSLSKVKDALERAVCFTTDEESLDEFCTVDRDVAKTTANREPLRTPSMTSAGVDNGSFPWTKALHMTTPLKSRKLSVIPDTISEDMFPDSDSASHDWFSKADTRSIESTVDSGLGISIDNDSPNSVTSRSRPMAIASSLPVFGRASSTFQSLFGRKKSGFESRSWSDLQDEEEEERAQYEREQTLNKLTALSRVDSEEDGRSTPRGLLPSAMLQHPSSNESVAVEDDKDDLISEHTGFMFEEHIVPSNAKADATPTKRSLIDKWSALGDRRRGGLGGSNAQSRSSSTVTPTPDNTKRRFTRPSTWRRSSWKKGPDNVHTVEPREHDVLQQKEWNTSKDWRRSDQFTTGSPLRPHESQLDGAQDVGDISSDEDAPWIGGWKSLQV